MSRASMRLLLTGLLIAALTLIIAPGPALAKISVVVSIPPQRYFVQKVGGDLVAITVMVPAGADAHAYEPRPKQMAELQKARIYFAVGVEFEEIWLDKFKAINPKMLVVHTEAQVLRVPMEQGHHEGHGETEHHHQDQGHQPAKEEHHHQGLDPHIWLAPALVAIQAQAIRDGLVKVDPANQKTYDKNLLAFKKEIAALHTKLTAAFQGLQGHRRVLVFHPAWGYFCRAYGLEQVAIEKEGKQPTAKGLEHLIRQAREQKARVIFVQPQFSTKSANTVAQAIKGQVVPIDPLAPDWAANLQRVAEQVKKGLY